jgi:Xaa-Pro aminopeptidase
MNHGFLDRNRASALMAQRGIDALIVVQPENFRYATGAHPGFPSSWRRAGTQIAVVPASPEMACAVVIPDAMEQGFRATSTIPDVRTHPIWTDRFDFRKALSGDPPAEQAISLAMKHTGSVPASRPSSYDLSLALGELRGILSERGLLRARLGIEFDFSPVNDTESFRALLPEASFHDSSEVFRLLRLIKNPEEIRLLRLGAKLAEAGIREVVRQVKPGQTAADLSLLYRSAVVEEARANGGKELESEWTAFCCGPEATGAGASSARLEIGHAVKLDCGCRVSGYISDVARTFLLGRGTRHQRALHEAILESWNAGLEAFRPGNPLKLAHEIAQSRMRKLGYTAYTRGHVGHSLGSTTWNEEWPFISAQEATLFQENMVLAYEVPVYADGLGAFTIEDHILVTKAGHESMNGLPRGYCEIS